MSAPRSAVGLIDVATNLTDCVFRGITWGGKRIHDDDFATVLQRAVSTGVQRIIITGTSLEQSARAIHLCRKHKGYLFCTVGVHPSHAAEFLRPVDPLWNKQLDSVTIDGPPEYVAPECLRADGTFFTVDEGVVVQRLALLEALVEKNRDVVVGYGECGLDYAELKYCPLPIQKLFFARQLELAVRLKLPLVLHSRDCGMDCVEMLQAHVTVHGPLSGIVHSFTGSPAELTALLDIGLSIGLNGSAFRTKPFLDAILPLLPLARTVIESDAPWCDIRSVHYSYPFIETQFLTTKRGKPFRDGMCVERRVEPCHTRQVLEALCGARRAALGDVASETNDQVEETLLCNALRMFWPSEPLPNAAAS